MKDFIIKLISDPYGNVSSMRVMCLFTLFGSSIGFLIIMICLVHVVFTKDEFPNGFWQAMVSLASVTSVAFGAKSTQSIFGEGPSKAPEAPKEPD